MGCYECVSVVHNVFLTEPHSLPLKIDSFSWRFAQSPAFPVSEVSPTGRNSLGEGAPFLEFFSRDMVFVFDLTCM